MLVHYLSFAWRCLRRDARAGELTLLAMAVAIAVAALAAVGMFSERMRVAIGDEARQLLGADLVLTADREPSAALDARAVAAGLRVTRTVVFPSMVGTGQTFRLGSVKAVGTGYPLRGKILLQTALDGKASPGETPPLGAALGIPSPGTLWLDEALLATLGVKLGDSVTLGESRMRIEAGIVLEPDRGASFVNFSPRVMLRLDDLAATGLLQPASRVTWRLLVAGEPGAVETFRAGLKIERGQRIETLQSGRPELRTTLDRAERFLALVALLTALLAAVAIGLGAQRFAQRHVDGIAVMKALGVTQNELVLVTLLELTLLGFVAAGLGVLMGWGAQMVLVGLASPLLKSALPSPSWAPALQALAAGMVLLLGAASVPLRALAGVPPLRVLRRELPAPSATVWQTGIMTFLGFSAIVLWSVRDLKLAAIGLGGFVIGTIFFVLAAALAMRSSGWLRRVIGFAGGDRAVMRVALASWSRRRGASIAQTAALAVALMALVLLTVTRDDLLASWRRASPADAPNRFLINIQPEQREPVRDALRAEGVALPEFYPMVRGRLVAINDKTIISDQLSERARQAVDRELNLTYGNSSPAHNKLIQGRDLEPDAAEVTVEQGLAQLLELQPGARLSFDIAGEQIKLTMVGIRKLDWDSMKVNFFVMGTPSALAGRPQSWITAFHESTPMQMPRGPSDQTHPLDAPQVDTLNGQAGIPPSSVSDRLIKVYPNLTIFDTDHLIQQVQSILDRVSAAVEFLFVFTLAAGLVVLAAALAGSQDERVHEAALLRALGASRRQLAWTQAVELLLGGGAAGLLAALAAIGLAWGLAYSVFEFVFIPRWWTIPGAMLAGALSSLLVGWVGLRRVVSTPPIVALRS